MDFELSTYQKKILDEFKNSNDNLFISARAGASKTFMLVEISKLINTYSVFLAFNKVIQLELANRIKNPKFRTYTLNGLGYQILLKNAEEQGLPKITIDQYKTSNICRKIASSDIPEYKTYNWELKKECINTLTTLYELCRACLYDMGDYNQLKEIIKENNLFQEEVKGPLELTKIMNRIDTLNMYQFEHDGIISFSDQLYITVKKLQTKEWAVPGYLKFFNILVDECMPGNIRIKTNEGQITLQKLYKLYENKEKLPMAKSYNEENDIFEYKQILNVKKHKNRKVYEIVTEGLNKMQATENHKFLTQRGYVAVSDLVVGKDILMLDSSTNQNKEDFVKSINYIGKQDVYDIEVQDNHNFVCTKSYGENIVGIISHNCQDLNAVQQQLIYYIRRKDAKIISVGDKFQSIYGFNGSDKYAIDNFKRIYKMKELELPICYRCPKSHLRYVNKEFPNIGIQSAPFAKEGAIKIIDEEEIMDYVQIGDFILSRKNKNLCYIVLSLLEKGIPIYFKDAQFVEKIIKKVEKIEKKVNNIYELEEYIVREQQSSKDKLKNAVELFLDKGEEKAHQDMEKYNYSNEIVDLFDCILILLKNYLNKNKDKICTIQKFINYIREMLNTTERKNAVVCSSIHQSKGSETNNVFVLDEAKPAIYNFMTPDQIQQEKNLSYVALTRAKENLYLVVMPDEDEEYEYSYSKFINKSNQVIDEFDADEDAGEYFDIELEDMLP